MRNIPSIKALECFETTARLGTVREAAQNLSITPSAVSHQISNLEKTLNQPLFSRRQKRLHLTDAGQAYLQQINVALSCLEDATDHLRETDSRKKMVISCAPSLLALWLAPKLSDFASHHKNINFEFINQVRTESIDEHISCSIEYRLLPPKDRFSIRLFKDEVVPLAHPEYCHKHNLINIDNLKNATLIMTQMRMNSWRHILKDAEWLKNSPTISVRHSNQALNLAVSGAGIALGNRHIAANFIKRGELKQAFDFDDTIQLKTPSYYFSCHQEKLKDPHIASFLEWIRAQ